MQNLRTLEDLGDVKGKIVLLRADLDVPVEKGEVVDNFRLRKAINTIRHLSQKGAKVIILGHLGRPEGKYDDKFSLIPVRFELGKLLDMHIKFAHIDTSRNSILFMEDGEILLLENTRFHAGEEGENPDLREKFMNGLVELADFYVNDAFASYRPQASNYYLAQKFDNAVAGLQLTEEINKLSSLKNNPEKPYVAVIGGSKLDTKTEILKKLVTQANYILMGGAMAYTMLKAKGISVGNSLVEDDNMEIAREILELAKQHNCELLLPVDHFCGKEFSANTEKVDVDTQQIPDGLIGMDIGDRTLAEYLEIIKSARSILWSGPMGVFEWENFARGTEAIGEYIGLSASKDAFKVAGGGDTVFAMDKLRINMKNYTHVSTGGGAMLAFLAGENLEYLEPLMK